MKLRQIIFFIILLNSPVANAQLGLFSGLDSLFANNKEKRDTVVYDTIVKVRAHKVKTYDPHDRKQRRIDREIQKLTFIPKGTYMGGASLSYSEQELDNVNVLVMKDIDCTGYSFGISPFVGYFVADNIAVGLRYNYTRTYLDLGSFSLNLGEDFNINLKDISYKDHKSDISFFARTYAPIGRSKVFGFFSEMRLTYGYQQTRSVTGRYEDGTLDGTYGTTNSLQIGFAPGLTAFVQDWMACEVQLGVMGFGFRWTDQKTNQEETGSQRSLTGKFKIDLFSISIGTTIYI